MLSTEQNYLCWVDRHPGCSWCLLLVGTSALARPDIGIPSGSYLPSPVENNAHSGQPGYDANAQPIGSSAGGSQDNSVSVGFITYSDKTSGNGNGGYSQSTSTGGFSGNSGSAGATGSNAGNGGYSAGYNGNSGSFSSQSSEASVNAGGFGGHSVGTGSTNAGGFNGNRGDASGNSAGGFSGNTGSFGYTGAAGLGGSSGSIGFNSNAGSGFNANSGSTGFNANAGTSDTAGFSNTAGTGFNANAGYSGGFNGNVGEFSSQSSASGHTSEAKVQNNVYFYDAPEDEEPIQLRVKYQSTSGIQNRNTIFIKAPAAGIPQIPQISLQNQNEEKTRVYVLVKKQDGSQEIVIPTAGPGSASKPEVYFIKYQTQKDAHDQIQSIQQGGSGGVSASDVDSDVQFVNTIRDTQSSGSESHHHHHHHQGTGSDHDSITVESAGKKIGQGGTDQGASSEEVNSSTNFGPAGGSGYEANAHQDSSSEEGSSSEQTSSDGNSPTNFGPAGESGPYKK